MKNMLKTTVQHTVTCKQFGSKLSEFGVTKERLSEAVVDIYAIESMTYLTAGLLDKYEDQDCILESAIVNVSFSNE